jgi:hypothetical protein
MKIGNKRNDIKLEPRKQRLELMKSWKKKQLD